jgi:membrane fusion protein, adhesin transport system
MNLKKIRLKRNKPRVYIYSLLLMVGATVCWSYYGRIDIVTIAPGVVVPSSKIKIIKHLEGGIIRRINVREGDQVIKGETLVDLEVIVSGANLEEINVRLTRLQLDIVRLKTELSGDQELKNSEENNEVDQELIEASKALLKTRRRHINNLVNAQKARVLQLKQGEMEINERVSINKSILKIINEKMLISEELLKEDLTNRLEHLDLENRRVEIEGKIKEGFWAIQRIGSEKKEAIIREKDIRENYISELRSDIDEKESLFRELFQRRNKIKDRLNRSTIRSPVDGKVKVLYHTTTGGIIKPGETILDLVPNDDRLLVEAKLAVEEVVYISLGQKAIVQLAARGNAGSAKILGKVIYISADSITKSGDAPFYLINIKLEKDYFEENGNVYKLLPGIQVFCSILTGSRSIMGYIFDPFFNIFDVALRER